MGKKYIGIILDTLQRSLIYNKKRSGPKIDPCGTPHRIILYVEQVLLYCTYAIDYKNNFPSNLVQLHGYHNVEVYQTKYYG